MSKIALNSRIFNAFLASVFFKKNMTMVKKFPLYPLPRCIMKNVCLVLVNFGFVVKAEPVKYAVQYNECEDEKKKVELIIEHCDELFSMGKFEDCLKILKTAKDSNDVEILWRISRALYSISKKPEITSSEKASLILESYDYISRAMSLDTNHYAVHKWMAILVDAKSALDGIKSRIKSLPLFKEHLMKAIELNPKDATSIYMLGQYLYNIADMSWLQRNIAKALFGEPPEATFEEAFHYFIKAEEVEPNFYSANLLMLGKTCMKLKKIEAGRFWLKCAIAYPVTTDEDEAVRLEAEELLKRYPMGEKNEKNEEKTKM